jgi:hypothetical protein
VVLKGTEGSCKGTRGPGKVQGALKGFEGSWTGLEGSEGSWNVPRGPGRVSGTGNVLGSWKGPRGPERVQGVLDGFEECEGFWKGPLRDSGRVRGI